MARRHVIAAQGPTGEIGHDSPNGETTSDRAKRFGKFVQTIGENIDYGSKEALQCVCSLVIDDGVKSRSHRVNIFNPKFQVVGLAHGPHKKYHWMCVHDYAGGFVDSERKVTDAEMHRQWYS